MKNKKGGLNMVGKGKNSLFKELELINFLSDTDSIQLPDTQLHIHIKKTANGLGQYVIDNNVYNPEKEIIHKQGQGLGSLKALLNDIDKDIVLNKITFVVLMCHTINPKRCTNGKIESIWVEIPIGGYYEFDDDGKLDFDEAVFEFTDEEHILMTETNLALYDYDSGNFYPVTKESLFSFGKMIEASSLFRKLNTPPLKEALCIAEGIGEKTKIDITYKNIEGKIKPIQYVCSYKNNEISSFTFMKTLIDKTKKFDKDSYIDEWSVGAERIVCNIIMKNNEQIQMRMKVLYSSNSNASRVEFQYKIYNQLFTVSNVTLFKNRSLAEFLKEFQKEYEYQKFEVMPKIIDSLDKIFTYNSEIINAKYENIIKKLGKTRAETIEIPIFGSVFKVEDFIKKISVLSNFNIPDITKERLECDYGNLLFDVLKEVYKNG